MRKTSQTQPLLTAQVEIAIDIDAQQMRTGSSWLIRCVRGIARSLELKVDDADQITGLDLDDQSLEDEIEQREGPGSCRSRLMIRFTRERARRLVLKMRRGLGKAVNRRIAFTGFPLTSAREQSGYIGITRSPNLYVGLSAPLGCTGSMPASCQPNCGAAVDGPGLRVSGSAVFARSAG